MSALKDLLPGSPLGDDQKVYDYILEGIKTKNCGVEIVTSAFVEDLKKRGVNTARKIFHMTDDQIDRAEFFLDLHRSKKGEINLPSREKLMRIMNDDFPSGGYALVKRTFDRLVKIGFDLDAADFILVDEEEEEALEAFRRMRVPVEE